MSADLEVGVYGFRTYCVEEVSGTLLPMNDTLSWRDKRRYFSAWTGGKCVAECFFHSEHRPPELGCTCGIYSFKDIRTLREQFGQAQGVVAVVALEGRTLEGDFGWRSQAGRVVAIWAGPEVLAKPLRSRISRRVPGLRWFDDIGEMVHTYTGTTYTEPDAPQRSQNYWYDLRKTIVMVAPSGAWPDDSEMRVAIRMLKALFGR